MALSIASAARKRGWEGTGGAGGAVTIAEAIAKRMRGARAGSGEGLKVWGVSVAPNGFINFEADLGTPSTSVSSDALEYHSRALYACEMFGYG